MMPLRMVDGDLTTRQVGTQKLKDHGDENRLFDGQCTGAHGSPHGIGNVIGADSPGHEKAKHAGHDEKNSAVLRDNFH